MNKRAYLANLASIILILPFLSLNVSPVMADSNLPQPVPWQSTFAGINAPTVPAPLLTSSSPFQTIQAAPPPASLQDQQQTNNPFALSPNAIPPQTVQATASSIVQLLTSPSTPLDQKINGMFTNNTTIGGQPMKVTPGTKYRIPAAAQTLANLEGVSFTQQNTTLNQPLSLFPNNPALLQAYNNFMNALKEVPSFFPLFRKIHITALHQIYLHLVGIYTSLNMTHMDDLKSYMATEKKYALNKKTLIINHLINVVMAQLNQALRTLIPGLPESYAITTGMGCMETDKVSDPNMLVLDIEQYVLSTLGLEKITPTQTSLAYLGIRKYLPLMGIQTTPELEMALSYLNSTPFPPKNFPKEQALLLSTTIYKILAFLNQEQNLKNLDAIIGHLRGTTTAPATSQEVKQFTRLVAEFSYVQPLTEQIALVQKFNELLGNDDATVSETPLSPEEIQGLKGILGYLLQQYEKQAARDAIKIIDVLGALNPTYQTLSPSQSVKLKALALKMLGSPTSSPVLLENLSDSDGALLAYGLWVTSNNQKSSLSPADRATVQTIAFPLKEHALSMGGLTSDQQNALEKALVEYSTYTLIPDPYGDMTKKIILTPPAPGQANDLEKALQIISSPTFTTFNKLTTPEQILLLQLFQNMNQFVETRLEINKVESTTIHYLLSQNVSYQKALLKSITVPQYHILIGVEDMLQKIPTILQGIRKKAPQLPDDSYFSFSFNTLIQMRKYDTKPPLDPLLALRYLFRTSPPHKIKPVQVSKQATPYKTSYTDILLSLQQEHFQDETTAAFVKTISPTNALTYRSLFPLINKPDFSFDQLEPGVRTGLADTLVAYKKALDQNRSAKYTRTANNNDPTQHALETIADFLSYSQQFHSKRSSFLWVLKEYLLFFNLYAQSLQTVSNDPNNPSYSGLTQFADYAKSIQQELAYESSSNTSIAALLKKSNPPLFFYDADTFRGIRLLPKLALEIENNPVPIQVAPFPTFGIEQASSPTGTALDPLTGKTVSNSTSIGSFSYNKFFFLEAPDSLTEKTGVLPSWITKTAVPSTQGNSFVYEPQNMPQDGITGFYMNIPIFAKDPKNKNSVVIRLFEQPVIAQPAWLNKSGTGPKTPQSGVIPQDSAGVITVLRGCLGDFQSLLDLNIFDPCLTVIFSSALALSDNDLDVQTSKILIQDKGGKCAAYVKQKEALLKYQEDPKATVNQTVLGQAPQSQGATLPLPATALNTATPSPTTGVSQ
jgi:hypothetical protein